MSTDEVAACVVLPRRRRVVRPSGRSALAEPPPGTEVFAALQNRAAHRLVPPGEQHHIGPGHALRRGHRGGKSATGPAQAMRRWAHIVMKRPRSARRLHRITRPRRAAGRQHPWISAATVCHGKCLCGPGGQAAAERVQRRQCAPARWRWSRSQVMPWHWRTISSVATPPKVVRLRPSLRRPHPRHRPGSRPRGCSPIVPPRSHVSDPADHRVISPACEWNARHACPPERPPPTHRSG